MIEMDIQNAPKSKGKNLKKRKMNHLIVFCFFALIFLFSHSSCTEKKSSVKKLPVYEASPRLLVFGSILYNEAGCASCHGIQFDGRGPEAEELNQQRGLVTPPFRRDLPPKAIPYKYFQAMSQGTPSMKEHRYQSYTDRGRWAIAYYLYSLSTPIRGHQALIRKKALLKMNQMLSKKYEGKRRLEEGYIPIEKRSKSPDLDFLLSGKDSSTSNKSRRKK